MTIKWRFIRRRWGILFSGLIVMASGFSVSCTPVTLVQDPLAEDFRRLYPGWGLSWEREFRRAGFRVNRVPGPELPETPPPGNSPVFWPPSFQEEARRFAWEHPETPCLTAAEGLPPAGEVLPPNLTVLRLDRRRAYAEAGLSAGEILSRGLSVAAVFSSVPELLGEAEAFRQAMEDAGEEAPPEENPPERGRFREWNFPSHASGEAAAELEAFARNQPLGLLVLRAGEGDGRLLRIPGSDPPPILLLPDYLPLNGVSLWWTAFDPAPALRRFRSFLKGEGGQDPPELIVEGRLKRLKGE
ncbi:MAG: hypothetical protein LBQ61_06580 [Spirochaetales bacterium]|jgi:hypothetical protein|nr:hypothetical protein [Spirochaetales bacterium]